MNAPGTHLTDAIGWDLADSGVLTLSFNRPEVKNAIDTAAQGLLVRLLVDAARHPGVKVVVLTSFAGQDDVLAAVRAGVDGYLLKDVGPAELADALRTVYRGGAPLHPQVAATVMARVAAEQEDPLTPREREVLVLIGRGMPNKLIARELSLSEKTVKAHVSAILGKLDVADRTQAALYAVHHNLTTE